MWEEIWKNPHWTIPAAFGVFLGIVVRLAWHSSQWFVRLFERHPMKGVWKAHYFSNEHGHRIFMEETWQITRGFRHKYALSTESVTRPGMTFKGFLTFENNFMVVTLSGTRPHQETAMIRISYPVATPNKGPFVGLGVHHDFNPHPIASVYVIADKSLSEQEFVKIAESRRRVDHPQHMTIRIIP